MPTKKQLQEEIARVQGWTNLVIANPGLDWDGVSRAALCGLPKDGIELIFVPNWPGSLDTARELRVENKIIFTQSLRNIVNPKNYEPRGYWTTEVREMIFATAEQWCHAWLLSEHGRRWVECGCVSVDVCNNEYHDISCLENHHCPNIMCEGGRWEDV